MRRIILVLVCLMMAPIVFGELLTAQEIESELGSKTSFTKQEVVTIVHDLLGIVEEEMTAAQADIEKTYAEKLKQFTVRIQGLETERTVWQIVGGVEAGAIITLVILHLVGAF